jgi:anti-sigma-K factor RskA
MTLTTTFSSTTAVQPLLQSLVRDGARSRTTPPRRSSTSWSTQNHLSTPTLGTAVAVTLDGAYAVEVSLGDDRQPVDVIAVYHQGRRVDVIAVYHQGRRVAEGVIDQRPGAE